MEKIAKNKKELDKILKEYGHLFCFYPSSPEGVKYPVTVTIN